MYVCIHTYIYIYIYSGSFAHSAAAEKLLLYKVELITEALEFMLKFDPFLVILRVRGYPRKHLETPWGQECCLQRFPEIPNPIFGADKGLKATHLSSQIGPGRYQCAKKSVKQGASRGQCSKAGLHMVRRRLRIRFLL